MASQVFDISHMSARPLVNPVIFDLSSKGLGSCVSLFLF